ncbi:hypothetical protein HanRHA438_Chr02g0056711 [Helianthus annuus]|nr:hypothetical protein HanRHA438_Chr02g0056701 [Helianthus annuus]KAJ0939051.1 hypothetical protein HanRHA438_Chr02g0056711 [Helianthus annuus]
MSFVGFMFRRLWCFAEVLSSAEVCLLGIAEMFVLDIEERRLVVGCCLLGIEEEEEEV